VTLLSNLENDSSYRLLYARYLAWKHRFMPARLKRELSPLIYQQIKQEKGRYEKIIKQRRIHRETAKAISI